MGYYVQGNGHINIRKENEKKAYEAMCALNRRDDLKSGGSWGGGSLSSDDPRPAGSDYHPAKWFSWLDPNYPAKCESVLDVLCELGFEVIISELFRDDQVNHYRLSYDNKTGQQDLFLEAIAPFVENGMIDWTGEDHIFWRSIFENGTVKSMTGKVTYS